MSPKIDIPRDRIEAVCRKWGIVEMALFGSVLRDDFSAASDIDVMVKFSDTAKPSLFDMSRIESELEQLLGRPIDLVSRRGVEESVNELRKRSVLDHAEVIFAA